MSDAPKKPSLSQQDRVAAETLIRTSVLALANGAPVGDIDEVIRRNASNVSHEDVMAGRLNTSVIGDIINTVEQAKSNKPFNWTSATQAQIAAYIVANGIKLPGYGPDGLPRSPEAKADGAVSGHAIPADAAITLQNYQDTPFAKTGLSYENFDALKSKGFSYSNIIHAAQDTKANGFDVNNNKVNGAFAVLDKEDGERRDERNRLLNKLDDRLEHDAEFQRLQGLRDKSVGQERAALEQKMIARGKEVSKESGWRKHIESAPTPAARDAGEMLEGEKIKLKGAIGEYSHGNRAKADAVSGVMMDIKLNPQDAKARQNYALLKEESARDPKNNVALAKIVSAMKKGAEIASKHNDQNTVKAEDISEKKQELASVQPMKDDLFADLLATAPEKRASVDVSGPSDEGARKPTEQSRVTKTVEKELEKRAAEKPNQTEPSKPTKSPVPKTRLAGSPSLSA